MRFLNAAQKGLSTYPSPSPSCAYAIYQPSPSQPDGQTLQPSLHPKPPLVLSERSRAKIEQHPKPPLILSESARAKMGLAIQHSLAPSTSKGYKHAVDQYHKFCHSESIPVNLRFPAPETLICAFAASNAGQLSGSTIRNHIAGLRNYHIKNGLDWNGGHRLQYILNGAEALSPAKSNLQPRPPVTADMLDTLIHHLDLNDPLDAAVAACASVAFWGQCRLGELLRSSALDIKNRLIPSRRHLTRSSRHKSQNLHLPCTKTSRRGDDVTLVPQQGQSNPISLLSNHLRVNTAPSPVNLFAYNSSKGLRNLTKTIFISKCNSIWANLSTPRITGHCFRIGGTTELLLAGVPPDVVRKMGRWKSDSFLRYWRSVDHLADLHAKNIHIRSR